MGTRADFSSRRDLRRSRDLTMSMDRSYFTTGVSALFEMATSDAIRILPPHLQPIEVRPQRSILNVTAFHFRESDIGPYAELMFSVVVPPLVHDWGHHPKGAFFPFMAATSSEESRKHRSRRLRIPHFSDPIDTRFIERADEVRVQAWTSGKPVVDLVVTQHEWQSSTHLLHSFMMDGGQRLKADVEISGRYTMHEQERGRMTLYHHAMTQALTLDEVSAYPFREHWLKEGHEDFSALEIL